jgi:hypothetical protein
MDWFFKPKVQLGLFVNFAFVVFTLVSSTAFQRTHGDRQFVTFESDSAAIPYAQLPPPSGPSRANSFTSGGRIYVSLNNDLTLIKRPGLTLTLYPVFNTRSEPLTDLSPVRLTFARFSNGQTCPGDCPLVINTDGVRVWPRAARNDIRPPSTNWTRESVPHSSRVLSDGNVLETLAAETLSTEIPYDVFVEVVSARRVTIKLGDDSVELSAEKLEALRDMYRQLAQQPKAVIRQPNAVIVNSN